MGLLVSGLQPLLPLQPPLPLQPLLPLQSPLLPMLIAGSYVGW